MSSLTLAAVRGAISVSANTVDAIRSATSRLLAELIERNQLTPANIVSAVFTATPDLTADFPAHSARRLGWSDVPLLGATEMSVPGAPKRIVRVLVTVRDVPRGEKLQPVYLDEAARLRPDLVPTGSSAHREQREARVGEQRRARWWWIRARTTRRSRAPVTCRTWSRPRSRASARRPHAGGCTGRDSPA